MYKEDDMTVQEIIDYLSTMYDSGLVTRYRIRLELEDYEDKGYITEDMIDSLFDLIVG